MDFDLSDDQIAVRDLAARMFARNASAQRLADVERSADRIDRVMWHELASSGLLGLAVPTEYGGSALGLTELMLPLIEQGRHVPLVPLWECTALGAPAIAHFGSPGLRQSWLPRVVDGSAVVTAALEPADVTVTAETLTGHCMAVPAGHLADAVIVPVADDLFLVETDQPGVTRATFERTDRALCADLTLTSAAARRLDDGTGDRVGWLRERAWVGLAALQLGVSQEALRRAAEHVAQREQFGVRLGTFQAVAHQVADCRIATDAMEVTLWEGIWRLDTGRPAPGAVHVARWWAADAGDRVARIVQHLHGGLGADVTYPIHRYLLWSSQLANTGGSAAWHLDQLSHLIATGAAR